MSMETWVIQCPWSTISFPVVALSQLKPLLSAALLICDLPLKTQGLIVCEGPDLFAGVVEPRLDFVFLAQVGRHMAKLTSHQKPANKKLMRVAKPTFSLSPSKRGIPTMLGFMMITKQRMSKSEEPM